MIVKLKDTLLSSLSAALLMSSLLFLPACDFFFPPAPNDALEPNNSLAEATILEFDTPLKARSVQGDPDVFLVSLEASSTVIFKVATVADDNKGRLSFTVTDADGFLFEGRPENCRVARSSENAGVTLSPEAVANACYLRLSVSKAGTYYLTLIDRGEADNIFPTHWDYQVEAELE